MHFENPLSILVLLIIALIVLGPKRLPEAGRALGQGIRGFRDALTGGDHYEAEKPPAVPAATPDKPAE